MMLSLDVLLVGRYQRAARAQPEVNFRAPCDPPPQPRRLMGGQHENFERSRVWAPRAGPGKRAL